MQWYEELTLDNYLDLIKEYVVGMGPDIDSIIPIESNLLTLTDLVILFMYIFGLWFLWNRLWLLIL